MSKTLREFYSGDLTVRVSTDIDEEAAAFGAKWRKPTEPERHTMLLFELYDDDGDVLYEQYVDPFVHYDLDEAGHRYTYDVLMPHVERFIDEAIVMNKRAAHALRTRAEPVLLSPWQTAMMGSAPLDQFIWRRRRGPPTRGIPKGLINAHEWEENHRNAELGAEHLSEIRATERRLAAERRAKLKVRRDPDRQVVGYKVMRYDPQRREAVSMADSRQRFQLVRGVRVAPRWPGLFLSPNRDYVLDYYAGHNDEEVLLVFNFDPRDVTRGNLLDREAEVAVREARLVDFEILR